jgi:hypothetical protein
MIRVCCYKAITFPPCAPDSSNNARITLSRVEVIWIRLCRCRGLLGPPDTSDVRSMPFGRDIDSVVLGQEDEAIHPYLRALRHASHFLAELKPVRLLSSLPPLRQGVIWQLIVLLPVMMLLQVAPCMQQHRVNAVHGCLGQPGTRRDQT